MADEVILTHHKGGFSSSRLGIVCKHPLLTLAASVEAARSWENRSILSVCEDFHGKADAERTRQANFRQLEALTNSEEILSLKSSTTDQTTVNVLLSEDLCSV